MFKTKDPKTSGGGIIGLIIASTSREKRHSCSQIEAQAGQQMRQRYAHLCLQTSMKMVTSAHATCWCHRNEGEHGPAFESMMPAHQVIMAYFQWRWRRLEVKSYVYPASEFPFRRTRNTGKSPRWGAREGPYSQTYDLRPGSPIPFPPLVSCITWDKSFNL